MAENLSGHVIAYRRDRLGARLMSIVNATRISQQYSVPMKICWPTAKNDQREIGEYAELFSKKYMDSHFIDHATCKNAMSDALWLSNIPKDMSEKDFRLHIQNGGILRSGFGPENFRLPWESGARARTLTRQAFGLVGFHKDVLRAMEQVDRFVEGQAWCGYHVRRGDLISGTTGMHLRWGQKYAPHEIYAAHICQAIKNGNTRIMVFSDSVEEIHKLKELNPCVLGFDDVLADQSRGRLQRDFLEIYAMSRCRSVAGPPLSAFSFFAATLGGGEVIDVSKSLALDVLTTAQDTLVKRLETQPESFLNIGDFAQSFLSVQKRLQIQGEVDRGIDILLGLLDEHQDQVDKVPGFLYSVLADTLVEKRDFDEVQNLHAFMQSHGVYNRPALHQVKLTAALSEFAAGKDGRIRLMNAAVFDFFSKNQLAAMNLMSSHGCLTPKNFYPFDPDIDLESTSLVALNNTYFGPPAFGGGLAKNRQHKVVLKDFVPELIYWDWEEILSVKQPAENLRFSENEPALLNRVASQLDQGFAGQNVPDAYCSARLVVRRIQNNKQPQVLENLRTAAIDVSARSPGQALYHKRVADFEFALGNTRTGFRALEQAIECAGNPVMYLAARAVAYQKLGMAGQARKYFAELAEMEHEFAVVYFRAGQALRQDPSRKELALRALKRVQKAFWGLSQPLRLCGELAFECGDHKTSLNCNIHVEKRGGADRVRLQMMAQSYRALGQPDRAGVYETKAKTWRKSMRPMSGI